MHNKKFLLIAGLVLTTCVFTLCAIPAHAGPGGGTYYANSPAGGPSGTAIRKFVDSLPGVGYANRNNLGQYIPLATPDTGTYTGNDYYEIGVKDYRVRMHSDLPQTSDALGIGTKLRGYHQINTADPQVGALQYLGPLILARKGTPVRVTFVNELGVNGAGDLFLPVDPTIMGAGMGPKNPATGNPCMPDPRNPLCENYTENRAELHLHGGLTPWISDGTPHQWITPTSDSTHYKTGLSLQNVPDMMPVVSGAATTAQSQAAAQVTAAGTFKLAVDGTGGITPAEQTAVNAIVAAATAAKAKADTAVGTTNKTTLRDALYSFYDLNTLVSASPFPTVTAATVTTFKLGVNSAVETVAAAINGQGSSTYYYTNDQSPRLMFYHDHSYGITRLNVYAGEAAGYLLIDQAVEDPMIADKALPSQGGGVYNYGIPLIIQDKTFVPENINIQDSKWTNPNWGSYGDLWFPHVYEPNQDPTNNGPNCSPNCGMNPFGRWDWGPWFWPVMDQTQMITHELPPVSAVPEAFMDTPVVNGTVYPYMDVLNQRYRFRVLNACNDRTLNLQIYYAEPLTVAVVSGGTGYTASPTITFSGGGNPLTVTQATATATVTSGVITAITVTSPGSGYTSAPTVSISDSPGGGSGASAVASINTEIKMMTRTDGRPGGQPDLSAQDLTTIPPMYLIGTEGGFVPVPVVLNNPPVAVEYDNDPRSITVTNVKEHNLLLGPAQRADIIVDFSKVPAGSTLILYNDSPAPIPASDLRYDYYTGDPDNSSVGGAPTTLPGYGPNTRTLMQFRVSAGTPDLQNLTTLTTDLANAWTARNEPFLIPPLVYANNFSTDIQAYDYSVIPPILKTLPVHLKTIQELFELQYGRMNALLGTEIQGTNFTNQTTHQMQYIDLPTEVVPEGQEQVWLIVHNGVDTHYVHFHLFNVQVINRVDWAGVVKPPYNDEAGWRDTIRADPLEQVIVALKPIKPTVPGTWPALPHSIRPKDVTMPADAEVGLDTGMNSLFDYEWEYVWHCHLLGHEENDMMRPFVFQPAEGIPATPTVLEATQTASHVDLKWKNNENTNLLDYLVLRCTGVACVPSAATDIIARVTTYKPLPDVYNPTLSPVVDPALQPFLDAFNTPTYSDETIANAVTSYNYQVIAENQLNPSLPATLKSDPLVSTLPITTSTWVGATGMTVTISATNPHPAGTAVLFTAAGTGATTGSVYQYRFSVS